MPTHEAVCFGPILLVHDNPTSNYIRLVPWRVPVLGITRGVGGPARTCQQQVLRQALRIPDLY